jgi:uncharacterized membrane protein
MKPERPTTMIVVSGLMALLAAAAEAVGAPQVVRVVLGIPLVFVLPGYVAMCAVLPGRELSWSERMLATVGASLAVTTCVSVLLAALPVGLSRGSAAITLGVGTAALAMYAWRRASSFTEERDDPHVRRP